MNSNFYNDVLRKDPRFNSTECIKDTALLEPGTRAIVHAMIADAESSGHKLEVLETYRSQARQHALYNRRLTQLSRVGVHGYGLAVDLALYVGGKYDANGQHYLFMEALAKKHGMVSGIDWGTPNAKHTFRDYDHVQRIPVFRQNALFSGSWYPPASGYDPYTDQIAHGLAAVA